MALKIKKRGLFVALLVSVIVLVLGSRTWAQPPDRLSSYTTKRYSIGLSLGTAAREAAYNYVKAKTGHENWFPLSVVYVLLHERDNFRDLDGYIVGNGRAVSANLFLVLSTPDAPYPTYATLFHVRALSNNQDILDYHEDQGVMGPGEASDIEFEHEVKRDEGDGEVNSKFKVSHPDGSTIDFYTEWTEPEPTHFPADPLGPAEDLVAVVPFRYLRFADNPEWKFIYAQQAETFDLIVPVPNPPYPPIPTPQTDVSFEIDINLEGALGPIFNGLTEANVYRFNFSHYIQTIEAFVP